MNANESILTRVKTLYNSTTHFNKLPQTVVFDATPKILIKNISQTKAHSKDISGRFEVTYRVEVIGKVYMSVKAAADAIVTSLETFTDSYVHVCSFDGQYYDTNDEAEIHRVITDFRTFVNL